MNDHELLEQELNSLGDELRTLHQSATATKIPAREIAGAQCPGFRIEERQSTVLVWVDPKTFLPAYAERS